MRTPAPDILELVRTAPREILPAVLAAVAARLADPVGSPEPRPEIAEGNGKLLTAEQVALALGIDVGSVSRRRFPFAVKLGHRTVRFSSEGLERYMRQGGRSGKEAHP